MGVLFSFSCNQGNKEEKPSLSGEITITVVCDSNLTVKNDNPFKVAKDSTWKDIKEKAIEKITAEENFEIAE